MAFIVQGDWTAFSVLGSLSFQHPFVASIFILVTLYIGILIYRVTLHPLAKFPGPLRYKLSTWPLVYQCYRGNRHLYQLRDHERYGPVVRTGPNSLSFNTETALNAIYGSKSVNVKKSEFYLVLDSGAGTFTTHTEIDKEKHAAKRRVLSHAFSDSALRSAESFILENIVKWCNKIGPTEDREWSEKRNIGDWSNWLGYDIMGELAFGQQFDCLNSEQYRHLPTALTEGAKFQYWFSYVPFVWILRPFLTSEPFLWLFGKKARENAEFVQHACEQMQKRIQSEEKAKEEGRKLRKDFVHYLLESRDPKTGLGYTKAELEADSILLIAAGSDTVSTIIAAACFYLLRNPRTLEKATAEVRRIFSDASEIRSGPQLNSCVYLQAVLEESLRCASPVPSSLPREVMRGGMIIDGHHIPAGVDVGVPSYVIHHNDNYFPRSWEFQPERWIASAESGVSEASVKLAHRASCPFSVGSRGCIGRSVAYLEIKLTMAHILFRFDIREAAGTKRGGGSPDLEKGRHRVDEYQIVDCFGAARDGPMVEFRDARRK